MKLNTHLIHLSPRIARHLRRFWLAPNSFGVKALHILVVVSLVAPNFLAAASLAQAAARTAREADTAVAKEVTAVSGALEMQTRAQTYAQQFTAVVTPEPGGPVNYQQPGITSEVDSGGTPAAEEANQETFVMGPAGGALTAKAGQVEIAFASGTLTQTLDVQVSDPVGKTRPPYTLSGQPFRITAFDQVSGDPVTRFQTPITITVAYAETNLTGHESGLALFYYDTELGTWVSLPSRVYTETNRLVAQTDHLTDFDIDVNSWQASQLPNLQGFQVSSFTGAASYSYPFWVPPGPGGLQPSLALSYSSQGVDSATARTQASWVGMGWSLDVGAIERNMNGTNDDLRDDTFNLVVNGVSSMLLEIAEDVDGNPNTKHYRTVDETFWRVQYNKTTDTWTVWDKNGNVYYFEHRARFPRFEWGIINDKWSCIHEDDVTWKWGLSEMKNIHGQSLTYTQAIEVHNYKCDDDGDGVKENHPSDAAMYPSEILYANNRYKIVFHRAARTDFDQGLIDDGSANFFERSFLDDISIVHDANGDGVWEPSETIRKYDLQYNQNGQNIFPNLTWSAGGKFLTLTSIQEFGLGGDKLPATTFYYDGAHLDIAQNNYGGWVDFDYKSWHENDGNFKDNNNVLKGRKMVFDFNHDLSCGNNGDDPEGWSSRENANAVYCNGEERLQIDNVEAWHNIPDTQVQPNGMYILRANLITPGQASQVRFGLWNGTTVEYDETWHHFETLDLYEVVIWLPHSTVKNPELRIDCDGVCEIADFVMIMAPTRYRTITKTLHTGTGESYAFAYCYTNNYTASTAGNCQGSDTAKTSRPGLRHAAGDNPYSENYSDFNGHGMVTVFAPNGVKTVTQFCQKDLCDGGNTITSTKGSAQWVAVYGSDGSLASRTETHYLVSYLAEDPFIPYTLVMPKDLDGEPTNAYTGLDVVWSRTAYQIAATCEEEDNCLERRTTYAYDPMHQANKQFGNVTDVIEAYYNGISWSNYRATRTWYYPSVDYANYGNPNLPYLTGFAAATKTYDCSSGCTYNSSELLGATFYYYDHHDSDPPGPITFQIPPTVGKLTDVRTLMNQQDGNQYSQVTYTYDAWGNTETVTNYTGYAAHDADPPATGARTTTNVYDPDYHTYLVEVRGPLYHPINFPGTTFAYDKDRAVVTSLTDPNGNTTTAAYDAFGRLINVRKPGDAVNEGDGRPTIEMTYNDVNANNVYPFFTTATQKIDDTGRHITVEKIYDGMGRMTQSIALAAELHDNACTTDFNSATDECDIFVDYTYNDAGQPETQTIPYTYDQNTPPPDNVAHTTTLYDALGRVYNQVAPDGTVITYTYTIDSQDLQSSVAVTDGNGNTTTSISNIWGQVVQVTPPSISGAEPDHPDIIYTYDVLGRLTAVDKNSMHTEIEYDLAGRKIAMNDPDMGAWSYTYDALGNLLSQTDANGIVITFAYDNLNRLLSKTYDISANPDIVSPGNVSYTYDEGGAAANALGQRTRLEDMAGFTTWAYDERGRVTGVSRTMTLPGLPATPSTFAYTYNKANMVETLTYPDNEVVTTGLTQNGVPEDLTTSLGGGYVNSAHYDALGRMVDMTLENGLTTTYEYYAFSDVSGDLYDGRLKSVTVGQALLSLVYNEYDAVGNIIEITDNSADVGGQTRTYSYDELSRLQTAVASGGSGNVPGYNLGFNYDSDGRLASKSSTVDNITTTLNYAYDETIPKHPHAAISLGNPTEGYDTYAYDANGNMTDRNEDGIAYTQQWNADNKLYQVTWEDENGVDYQTTFLYDGDSNRLLKIEDVTSGTNTEITTLYLGGLYEQEFNTTSHNLSDIGQNASFPNARMLLVANLGSTLASFVLPLWDHGTARFNAALQELAAALRTKTQQIRSKWHTFWEQAFQPAEPVQTAELPVRTKVADAPTADWETRAFADLAAQEYDVTTAGHAYQAPNRAQGVRTRFAPDGTVSWTDRTATAVDSAWELTWKLTGFGRESQVHLVGDPVQTRAEGSRFEYQYSLFSGHYSVVEWYVNETRGVEQGFTLAARPEGEGLLVLEGATNLVVVDDDEAVLLDDGKIVLTYSGLKAWDARGRELAARLEGTEEGLRILVADAGAVYPITVDPLVKTPDWTRNGSQAGAQFSYAVSTAGDVNGDGYSDVIIGAPFYDNGQTDEGAAFVYYGSPNGLSATPAWMAEGNQPGAYFGRAVATAGDVNGDGYSDVIIGADGFDAGSNDVGQAQVYYGRADGLSTSPAWTVTGTQSGAAFATAVNTAGDVNNDGCSDVVVGAYLHVSVGQQGSSNGGLVAVYDSQCATGGGLSTSPSWTRTGEEQEAWFGFAVAPAGDVNGDGLSDLIIGAPRHGMDNQSTGGEGWVSEADRGKVYLFYSNGSGLNNAPDWTAQGDQAGAQLGYAVSTAGDVDGDGKAGILAGAPFYDNGQTDEGRVYLYEGSFEMLWTLESDQANAHFGQAVSPAGDVNGDGYADILVGAPAYSAGQTGEGQVFVYHGPVLGGPAWTAEGNQTNAHFGQTVSPAGDVNGDGLADILVGTPHYFTGQANAGRAAAFYGDAGTLQAAAGWTAEGNKNFTALGQAVNTAGDVNGDGYADLVIGAPEWDNGQTNEGRALVYHGGPGGWSSIANWMMEINQGNAKFGTSVSTAGDVNGDGYADLAVGAPYYDDIGVQNEGRVFVYHGTANGLNPLPAWVGEGNQANALYGYSASTAGDVNGDGYADLIVGAPDYDGPFTDGGAAFVYFGSAAGLSATADLVLHSDAAQADFGTAVSTAGDVNGDGYSDILVGAPAYDMPDPNWYKNEGAAFAYYGSATGPGTAHDWVVDGLQANAAFGQAVASAGDVNGDGFADVVIGAPLRDNGQTDEGMAFVYYGSAAGLSPTAGWSTESNQAGAQLGWSLGAPGDLNGDGYSDLALGAPLFDGETTNDNDGKAWVFYGAAAGLPTAADWAVPGDQNQGRFGQAVSVAGDANGDGYAELAVGAPRYDSGQTDEGKLFVYYGNGGLGTPLRPRQLHEDRTPLAPLGRLYRAEPAGGNVEFRLFGYTPFGCGRVRLEWELQPLGVPLAGTAVEAQPAWTNTCTENPDLFQTVTDLAAEYTAHHWRVRVGYHPADFPFQQHGRWLTNPWNGWNEADFRTNETTAPESDHSLAGTMGEAGWYVSPVEITLTATDPLPGSGVAYIQYTLARCADAADWQTYAVPFTYARDGAHNLCYRAVDNVGNVETAEYDVPFHLDATPPATAVTIAGLDENGWTRLSPATVTLSAADLASGVHGLSYRVDPEPGNDGWTVVENVAEVTFTVAGDGYHVIEFKAQDNAGNWESLQTKAFHIDSTAPLISAPNPAPFALINDTQPALSVQIDNTVNGTTLNVTMYLDGNQVPVYGDNPNDGPETFTHNPPAPLADGTHTVYVLAVDAAGNRTEKVWQFTIDAYTWLGFQTPFEGTIVNRGAVTLTLETEPGQVITVTLADTTPNGSGTVRTYTTTNGVLAAPAWPLRLGANTLSATAADPAGNTAVATLGVTYTHNVHTAQVYAVPDVFAPSPNQVDGTTPPPRTLAFVARAAAHEDGWEITGWRLEIKQGETAVRTFTHQDVKTLVSTGSTRPAEWTVLWDGRNDQGALLPDGPYTYGLEVYWQRSLGGLTEFTTSAPGTLVMDSTAPAPPSLMSSPVHLGKGFVWFRYAAAVWGTVSDPDVTYVTLHYKGGLDSQPSEASVSVRVQPDGRWLANLPLAEGQIVWVYAVAVDAAGNESAYTPNPIKVGLSGDTLFAAPYAGVAPMVIGLNTDVTLTATINTTGAPLAWLQAQVPVAPYQVGLNPTGIIGPGTEVYTGTWHTPSGGKFQGTVAVLFQAEDTAAPPLYEEVLVTPYLDLLPPWIAIHQPVNQQVQGGTTLTVTGVAEPYSTITVAALPLSGQIPGGETPAPVLDGVTTSDGAGYWQLTLYPYNGGRFTVTAQATDRAGNVGPAATALVTVDTTGPTVEDYWAVPFYINPQFPHNTVTLSALIKDNLTGVVSATAVIHNLPQIGNTVERQYTRDATNFDLFELLVQVDDDAAEGLKQVTIAAWDWAENESQVTVPGFIVDRTPPRALDLALDKVGENLYVPDNQTVWHGPASVGNVLEVSVTVNDQNPPLDVNEVAGVDFVTFPNVFGSGTVMAPANGAVANTLVTWPFTATGTLAAGGRSLTATDRAGNVSPRIGDAPVNFTVYWDATVPQFSNFALTLLGTAHVYKANATTLYYAESATGTVQVEATATDSNVGMRHVTFPAFFGASPENVTSTNGYYARTYSIESVSGHGLMPLTAYDRVGNLQTYNFYVYQDFAPPTMSGINAPGSTNSSTFNVSWSGTDTGSGLQHYIVQFQKEGDTTWTTWLAATTQTQAQFNSNTQGTGDGAYTFRARGVDNVDNQGPWVTSAPAVVDTMPPVVTVNAPAQAGLRFTVSWSGTDASGIASYDVRYRDGNGSWQPWPGYTNTSATSGQFVGQADHTYRFQVRARDGLGNQSSYQPVPAPVVQIETITKYYHFGSQRAAMRLGDGPQGAVYYLHGDHLGSTSLTTDASGGLVSQARYMPYGDVSWESGMAKTDFGYTGQRAERGFGLMDYNARFYSPSLGRFVSADTIVPSMGNPMAWDRYSYVMGNPVRNVDPSGHISCSNEHVAEGDCEDITIKEQIAEFGVQLNGNNWTPDDVIAVLRALKAVGGKFASIIGGTAQDSVKAVYGSITITMGLEGATGQCATITTGGCTSNAHQINFASLSDDPLRARNNVVHELGHAFQNLWESDAKDLENPENSHPALVLGWTQSFPGYDDYYIPDFPNRPDPDPTPGWTGANHGFASPQNVLTWQVAITQAGSATEEMADMFLGWTFNTWEPSNSGRWPSQISDDGRLRSQFMDKYMPMWVNKAASP